VALDPSLVNPISRAVAAAPGVAGERWERDDEAAEIRFSLTALGEALVNERRGRPFRGFGPCASAGRGADPGTPRQSSRR
jgi:hypothetical protein